MQAMLHLVAGDNSLTACTAGWCTFSQRVHAAVGVCADFQTRWIDFPARPTSLRGRHLQRR